MTTLLWFAYVATCLINLFAVRYLNKNHGACSTAFLLILVVSGPIGVASLAVTVVGALLYVGFVRLGFISRALRTVFNSEDE